MVNENRQIVYEIGMNAESAAVLNAHEYILEVLFCALLPAVPEEIADQVLHMIRAPAGVSLPKGSGPVDMDELNARREAAFYQLNRFADKVEKRVQSLR